MIKMMIFSVGYVPYYSFLPYFPESLQDELWHISHGEMLKQFL